MKKNITLFAIIGSIGIIIMIVVIGVFYYHNLSRRKVSNMEKTLKGKKIVMVIAFRNFRDEEYFVPKKIFEEAGVEVKTASSQKGEALGADGGETMVDYLVRDVDPSNFNAIVFVGGPGCLQSLDNDDSYRLIQETVAHGVVLGSICISPVILANAGVLKGKKATVWSNAMNRNPIKILQEGGAIYQNKTVVSDGKIITGNGPSAARAFGEKVLEAIIQNS